jgi:hypothetical protein
MDTPTLVEALRAKLEALKVDFGDKAADRLREVLEHAFAQVTGRTGSGRVPRGATGGGGRSGRRTWTPAQKEEQRRKMRAYWASRKKEKGSSAPRGKRRGNSEKSAEETPATA